MEIERLGKYELQTRLGRGGMGEVWKARDTELRRYVAIKLLHADLEANPDFVTHFMREAQFVASLHHPNIVQIHDFQLTGAQGSSIKAYMVMDYIEGGTLADYIRSTSRKGLFPPATTIVSLFTAISLALDYAHQRGMIHRDIKPANILIDKQGTTGKLVGEPILTDFGIARLQGASTATLTHGVIGTPLYISPEQAKGLAVNERSDLYSLGIILYEIVTGITPFRGDSPLAIMMQHLNEMPPPPNLINPNIPPALAAVVLQSIAKDPEARFPTASAMTVALAQGLNVPVPAQLKQSKMKNEQPVYNPLQPPRPLSPPSTYNLPPSEANKGRVSLGGHPQTPGTGLPPSALTPASAWAAPIIPPAHVTPATSGDGGTRNLMNAPQAPLLTPTASNSNLAEGSLYRSLNSAGDRSLQSPPLPSTRSQHKRLLVAAIVCALLLLVGVSAFTVFPLLFAKHASTPTSPNLPVSVVGHIVFVSSPNAPPNTFDQLRIDLENIPPPPVGTAYYAWLENSSSEIIAYQHWEIQPSNGTVHGLYDSNPKNTDLLAHSTLFLITEESINSVPVIPLPDPSAHVYYARISQSSSSSPTFEIKQCPSSNTNNTANPCI